MELFCIFGDPINHSKSPLMHNSAFMAFGINSCYTRYLLKDGKSLKNRFLNLNLKGANITVPHKEDAFLACDEIRGVAKKIGAVNTIVLEKDKIIGYNTDALGFMESIKEFDFKNALILGAGGTAKAIAEIFNEKKIDFTIINRTQKRLKEFQKKGYRCYSWQEFKIESFDLIINTTSAGLDNSSLPLEKEKLLNLFDSAKFAVDVIYGKETPFLSLAKKRAIITKDGKDMLLYQGVLAFEIFTNFKYSKDEIKEYMQKGLELF